MAAQLGARAVLGAQSWSRVASPSEGGGGGGSCGWGAGVRRCRRHLDGSTSDVGSAAVEMSTRDGTATLELLACDCAPLRRFFLAAVCIAWIQGYTEPSVGGGSGCRGGGLSYPVKEE